MAAKIKHRKAGQLFLQGQGRKGRVGTSVLGVSLRTAAVKVGSCGQKRKRKPREFCRFLKE